MVPFWIFACDDLRIWSRLALICIQSPWTLPCDGNYILKTDAVQTARFDLNSPARPSAVSKITTSQPGQHCLSSDLAVDKLLKTTLLWKTVRTCEGSKCDREQFSCCFWTIHQYKRAVTVNEDAFFLQLGPYKRAQTPLSPLIGTPCFYWVP